MALRWHTDFSSSQSTSVFRCLRLSDRSSSSSTSNPVTSIQFCVSSFELPNLPSLLPIFLSIWTLSNPWAQSVVFLKHSAPISQRNKQPFKQNTKLILFFELKDDVWHCTNMQSKLKPFRQFYVHSTVGFMHQINPRLWLVGLILGALQILDAAYGMFS